MALREYEYSCYAIYRGIFPFIKGEEILYLV